MKLKNPVSPLQLFAPYLEEAALQQSRNLIMPGNAHYQPKQLVPYLGYDQWACFCVIVEYVWLLALAKHKIIPRSAAKLLTPELLRAIILKLTTTEMTALERSKTGHDIMALLELTRPLLPTPLSRWLHFGLTSYDVICTAYALQIRMAHRYAFAPLARSLDVIWRKRIREYDDTVRLGMTHLQAAVPVTVGSWLGNLHSRFVDSARSAETFVCQIPGKFSGAVGNHASAVVLFGAKKALALEKTALRLLELPEPVPCHQETPPEGTARFYGSLVNMSAALANLGEDTRHLQSTWVGEVITPGSRSSAMPHKSKNPVRAENTAGMYRSVVGQYATLLLNQLTDLERDLRDSGPMRGYSAIMVSTCHQMNTVEGMLGRFEFVRQRAEQNFRRFGKMVSAEALHLALQYEGRSDTHAFLNEVLVPMAECRRLTLFQAAESFAARPKNSVFKAVWRKVLKRNPRLKGVLEVPHTYIGTSVLAAHKAARRVL